MDRRNQLKDQAERAERLAHSGLDSLTTERLLAYAADCRNEIAASERDSRARSVRSAA